MGKPRNSTAPSPRSIASMSTALILVTIAGLAFYFGEVRGPGLQSFVTGSQIVETGVLCGILVALVVSAHLAIVNAVRQARAASPYRALVRRASQCDVADPDVAKEFESAPEVADLVRRLVSQHERNSDLNAALDLMREEIQGVVAGLRRSKDDLRPVRQDAQDAATVEITRTWNELLERVRTAPAVPAAPAAAEPVAAPVMAPAIPAFGEVDLGGSSRGVDDLGLEQQRSAFTHTPPAVETQEVAARLDRLESVLQQLAEEMRTRGSTTTAAPHAAAAPVIEAATPGSPFDTLAPQDDALIWHAPQRTVDTNVELGIVGAGQDPMPAAPAAVHQAPPLVHPALAPAPFPAFAEGPEATISVDAAPETPAFAPPQFTPPRFEMPRFEVPRFEPPRTELPASFGGGAPAQPEKPHFAAPESAFAQEEPRFEDLKFPHFVGQPVRKAQHVEVSYGSNEGGLFVEEDDAGARDEVVDLRMLGAVEFKE